MEGGCAPQILLFFEVHFFICMRVFMCVSSHMYASAYVLYVLVRVEAKGQPQVLIPRS